MANTAFTKAFPAHMDTLKVGEVGAQTSALKEVGGIVSITPNQSDTVQERRYRSGHGTSSFYKTWYTFSIACTGDYIPDDEGQAIILDKKRKFGAEAQVQFLYDYGDGSTESGVATVQFDQHGGGNSDDLVPLNFTLQADGATTYTPAT